MAHQVMDRMRSPSPPSSQDFTIFTSIRYDSMLSSSEDNEELSDRRDCALYMPELHRQRLWKAAAIFWPHVRFPELETTTAFETALMRELDEKERMHETYMCPMKVKYSFSKRGRTTVEVFPVPALPMEALFPTTFRLPSESPSSRARAKSRFGNTQSTTLSPRFLPALSPASSMYSSSRPQTGRRTSDDYFSTRSGSSTSSLSGNSARLRHDFDPPPSPTSSMRSRERRERTTLTCTYEIYLDTVPTPQDQHTSNKSSLRASYDAARQRCLPDPTDVCQEVLIVNSAGLITEGSLLTPYFHRNHQWITPKVDEVGGQKGTTRRWALEQEMAVEGQIEARSIKVGERIWLSNGVRGFGWGRVMATSGKSSSSMSSY